MGQPRIPYEFRHLTISDGLPDNTVYSCIQDSRGYIWFCTSNGVSRYDGRKFQNFSILEGLADSEIIAASEDWLGRIWFQSINGKLSYFDTKTEKIVSYREVSDLQKASGTAYLSSISVGADSSIWILVERYALKRLMPNGEIRTYKINGRQVMGVFADEQKRIFMAGDTFRLFDIQRDSFVDWAVFSINKEKKPLGKWHHRKDFLFFESPDGIFQFQRGIIKKIINKDIFKKQYLNNISADTLGNLWAGISNGYYKLDQNNIKSPRFYHTHSHVAYVFFDKEGNQWVCTVGEGVYFLPAGFDNISTFNKDNGLESEVVTALAKNAEGDIVAATYPNSLHFIDKKTSKVYRKMQIKGRWDVRVKHLYFPNKTDFWIQTDNYRLDYFPNFNKKYPFPRGIGMQAEYLDEKIKVSEVLSLDFGLPHGPRQQDTEYDIQEFLNTASPFKQAYFAKNGDIYTVSGVIAKATPLPNGRVKCHFFAENSRTRFYSIAEDTHGVMWFGGTPGVCFLRPNGLDIEFVKENFETTVNDIVSLSDDYILCSTMGNGVFLLKNGKIFKNWQVKDGLSSNSCNRLLKFNDQTVFIATAKGVTRLNFDPNDPSRMYPIIYGGKDAKPALFVNDLLLDEEKLYIASNNGLYAFKINDLKIQRNTPVVRLTQPQAYLIQPDTFLQLPYGWFSQENGIKFNYRAIAFCNGEVMHFRYRLFRDGMLEKKDSIVLREDFTLSLVSLNSGSYMIEMEASRGDDIWSKPVRSRFEVAKAIYRQPFALFIYWLIITIFTFELLRWRNRRRSLKQQRAIQRTEERLALERRQLEWEQEAVRARIDPHFVFNALNGILTFVYKRDIDSLKIQLPRLARFIRLSLNLGGEEFITVEQEVQYLNDYLALEKRRFEEQFEYSITITEGVDTQRKLLPPLLLQIFVENAVKHGVSALPESKKGVIFVIFERKEFNCLRCVIIDNGKGLSQSLSEKKADTDHNSLGLNLAKRRISLLNQIYGPKYTLDISDSKDGTKVIVEVKY